MCLQMTSFVQPAVQNPTTLHELHNNNCLIDLSLQLSFHYVLLFDFPNIFFKKVFFPHLQLAAAQLFAHFQPCVHGPLQVPLQPPAEVPEHGGASGEHDVLKHKEEVHVDQNRLTVTLTGAAEVLPCGSVPCTADVWHRWGSSGWLRPPPPRWAGWSLGWRTGRE